MSTEVVVGVVGAVVGALGLVGAAWFAFRGKVREVDVTADGQKSNQVQLRFQDASELANAIRNEVNSQVAAEVERQLAPIKTELALVRKESHEMNDAVRANVTQQWLWDQTGRQGLLPMLPEPILRRLGLAHLVQHGVDEDTVPSVPVITTEEN